MSFQSSLSFVERYARNVREFLCGYSVVSCVVAGFSSLALVGSDTPKWDSVDSSCVIRVDVEGGIFCILGDDGVVVRVPDNESGFSLRQVSVEYD